MERTAPSGVFLWTANDVRCAIKFFHSHDSRLLMELALDYGRGATNFTPAAVRLVDKNIDLILRYSQK
jgi:hypothetical protein